MYKNIIWGGRNIERVFNRKIPDGNIAESWEICCCSDGMSIVSNGSLRGMELAQIMEQYKEGLLGSLVYAKSNTAFPLLIKLIDANNRLSLQVHPDDAYALRRHGCSGKTEFWYIIDAKPGAKLIYGFKKDISREEFIKAMDDNNLESLLNEVPVRAGDTFFIPPGTIHTILEGSLIAEIQQNSNITYRIYDWGRTGSDGRPRDLHIKDALEVINLRCPIPSVIPYAKEFNSYSIKELSKSQYFSIDEIAISGSFSDTTDGSRFTIYMAVNGTGTIKYSNGSEDLSSGDAILVPASLGDYEIKGNIMLLRIYM